ncbi:unnamed protein product [Urochloa decumbens]|uniref:F-box domain-containing protein n=1 Tax=Urochloa decumbens TaxID=240449 RepID=A0ABC8Z8X0_9POAL
MPPVRRRDRAAAAAPYRRGQATSGCRQRGRRRADEEIDGAAALPDDAVAGIFSQFLDMGDVVRCAVTCRRWGRIVTARAGALARALPPPGRLLPRLAIGVFHQEAEDAPAARTRGSSPPALLPCFVPMASAARIITDDVWRPLIRSHGDGLLRNSRPVTISDGKLRRIGQAVVRRGVAFWPLDHGALGVRIISTTAAEITEMHLLPYDVPHYWPEARLLGVLPDDRLFFVYFGICGDTLMAKLSYFAIDGDDVAAGRKECSSLEEGILMHQMKVTCQDKLKLRWVCEKSGLIFFTLGESSGHSGTFALNLHDKLVEKVADGEGHKWRNFVGYEMGTAGYLASITPQTSPRRDRR